MLQAVVAWWCLRVVAGVRSVCVCVCVLCGEAVVEAVVRLVVVEAGVVRPTRQAAVELACGSEAGVILKWKK